VVVAQRLVRRICIACIESFHLSKEALTSLSKEFDLEEMLQRFKVLGFAEKKIKSFDKLSFYKGKGCSRCGDSGYKKRVAVMEILENKDDVQASIIRNASSGEINKAAKAQGMVTIFEDGMQKALLGLTTIEEVLRIRKE